MYLYNCIIGNGQLKFVAKLLLFTLLIYFIGFICNRNSLPLSATWIYQCCDDIESSWCQYIPCVHEEVYYISVLQHVISSIFGQVYECGSCCRKKMLLIEDCHLDANISDVALWLLWLCHMLFVAIVGPLILNTTLLYTSTVCFIMLVMIIIAIIITQKYVLYNT